MCKRSQTILSEIEKQFNPEILTRALRSFGFKQEQVVKDLDGFESHVFELEQAGQGLILKIVHSLHRSPEQINGEAHFCDYLASHGLAVAQALRSPQGNWVEKLPLDNGQSFNAFICPKLPGRKIEKADIAPPFFADLGRITGQMHALSKDYQPEPAWPRPDWTENSLFDFRAWIPAVEPEVIQTLTAVQERLLRRPRSQANFGLIHSDLHAGNFLIHHSASTSVPQIQVFDFDDSEYHWFANDIAMPIYYLSHRYSKDWHAFCAEFMPVFWQAYQQEHDLPLQELEAIHDLLLWRDGILYSLNHQIYSQLDAEDLEIMQERRQRLECAEIGIRWFEILETL